MFVLGGDTGVCIAWTPICFTEEKSIVQDELPIPDHPEYMVFVSYIGPLKYPVQVSALTDMVCAVVLLHCVTHLFPVLMPCFTTKLYSLTILVSP